MSLFFHNLMIAYWIFFLIFILFSIYITGESYFAFFLVIPITLIPANIYLKKLYEEVRS